MPLRKYPMPELNTSSVADIAFLLLSYFLMTTQITDEKGLAIKLPPWEQMPPQPVHERNLFKIQINSQDKYLIEGEPRADLRGVREEIKKFILNKGSDPGLSDNPTSATVSLKADRGTTHRAFIAALDEAQAAYYEIYAAHTGLSPAEIRLLDPANLKDKPVYERVRKEIPMNISIADPTQIEN